MYEDLDRKPEDCYEILQKRIEQCRASKLPELDLTHLMLSEIPAEVLELDWLEVLKISGSGNFANEFYFGNNSEELSNRITQLPENMSRLVNLRVLYAGNNAIQDILPLAALKNLEVLYLSDNNVEDIGVLTQLPRLSQLDLSRNPVRSLPVLPACTRLYVSGTSMNGPLSLAGLPCVEELDASSAGITELRDTASSTSLKKLLVKGNKFTELPDLSGLSGLRHLNISENILTILDGARLPAQLKELNILDCNISVVRNLSPELVELDIRHNRLEKIPEFSPDARISTLNIGHNQLTRLAGSELPRSIQKISFWGNKIESLTDTHFPPLLRYLDLSHNELVVVPPLSGMPRLETIILSWNKIEDIEGCWDFKYLRVIVLERNHLRSLVFLGALPALVELWLDHNELEDISCLVCYTGLKVLMLTNNRIAAFPPGFSKLTLLSELQFYKNINLIRSVPDGLLGIYSENEDRYYDTSSFVEEFWELGFDSFDDLPRRHYGRSPGPLLQWLAAIEQSARVNKSVRLIFCGNGRVGKSSILDCLQGREFVKNKDSTHAIAIERLELADLECWVWDFGGQEIYHSTHRLFMGQDAVYVLVWDEVTEGVAETPDPIDPDLKNLNFPLHYWVDFIRSESPDSPIIVVQNKTDNSWSFPSEEMLPTELNIRFITTFNAETGRGKEQLGFFIQQAAYGLPEYNMTVPEHWWQVQDHILKMKMRREKITMTLEEFDRICAGKGVLPEQIPVLRDYLHKVSTFHVLKNRGEDVLIIDEMWYVQPIYKVLERGTTFFKDLQTSGRFSYERFYEVVGGEAAYERTQIRLFLQLMQNIGLCFRINNSFSQQNEYIVPRFLAKEIPDKVESLFAGLEQETYYIRYTGPFNYHIIQQFIVHTGRKTDLDKIGRRGIFFNFPGGIIALIYANEKLTEINIQVAGGRESDRKRATDIIRNTFREIVRKYRYQGLIKGYASYDGRVYASIQGIHKQYTLHKDINIGEEKIISFLKVEALISDLDPDPDLAKLLWIVERNKEADFHQLPDIEQKAPQALSAAAQTAADMTKKIVFISYSHKYPAIKAAILKLADQLVSEGVDVILDQYIHGDPPEGWTQWMQDSIDRADFILLVFTEDYRKRWDGKEDPGTGLGVTREGIIINSKLYQAGRSNTKYRALVLSHDDRKHIPDILVSDYTSYCIPDDYNELYFLITEQPKAVKPPLGSVRKR